MNKSFLDKAKIYFSLYSPSARIWTHVIFWAITALILSSFGFNLAGWEYPKAALVHTFFLVVKSMFAYYIIAYLLLPLVMKGNSWFLFLIGIGIMFFLDSVISYYMFETVSNNFDTSPYYKRYAKTINEGGLMGSILFSKLFFIHIYNETLPILPPLIVKFVKIIIASRNKTISLQRDNLNLELNFLKSQVNPHFLFNVLNSIYSLIVEKDETAANIIVRLSGLMRYTLYETESEKVSLKREVEFIQQYTELERIRFQSRVNITLTMDDDFGNYQVPPLIFISFVENAFKHGVSNTGKASWVKIDFRMKKSTVILCVENSKPTHIMHEEVQGGIGLFNVKKRLELLYPDKYKLLIENKKQTFFVELQLELV